jgi:hypothetical protein
MTGLIAHCRYSARSETVREPIGDWLAQVLLCPLIIDRSHQFVVIEFSYRAKGSSVHSAAKIYSLPLLALT